MYKANGDNEEPKAKKVKKTKNKKKKTAKNKASEKESVNNPSTPVEKESVASEDKLTNGEADTEASSESMDKPQRPGTPTLYMNNLKLNQFKYHDKTQGYFVTPI